MKRREFLLRSAGGAALALAPSQLRAAGQQHDDPDYKALTGRALDAARRAGAGYADVRITRNRSQSIATRERRITGFDDGETFGFGVRALVNGAWGFAASRDLTLEEVERVARSAASQARASAATLRRPVELAPGEVHRDATWRSPIQTDPFDIPIEEKVALLLGANEAALRVQGARFVTSSVFFLREEKTYANTTDRTSRRRSTARIRR
jgi:TldD protein